MKKKSAKKNAHRKLPKGSAGRDAANSTETNPYCNVSKPNVRKFGKVMGK